MSDITSGGGSATSGFSLTSLEQAAAKFVTSAATDISTGAEWLQRQIATIETDYSAWRAANPVLAGLAADAVQAVIAKVGAAGVPVAQVEAVGAELLVLLAKVAAQTPIVSTPAGPG